MTSLHLRTSSLPIARAEERLQLALDAGAVAGTWFWDVAQDRFTGDRRFAQCFSLDPDRLDAGVPLAEVVQSIHPEDEPEVQRLVQEALVRGGAYRAEYRVREPGGAYRWIEANGAVTLGEDGRAVRFPGVLVDIETRKQAEIRKSALLALGDRLRGLDDALDIASAAAEICGQVLGAMRAGYGAIDAAQEHVDVTRDWNRDAGAHSVAGRYRFAHFGSFIEDLRRGEVVAIADVAHDPRTAGQVEQLWQLRIRSLLNVPLMRDGALAGLFLLHDDTPHGWTADDIAFVRGVADRTWSAIATAQAVAELKAVNGALEREVQARTADRNRLWKLSNDLMLVARLDGEILAANPAWERVLGWTEPALVGRSLFDLVHPDDLELSRAGAQMLAADTGIPVLENRYLHRDGSYRWISWSASPGDGLIVAAGRDVSQVKAQAESLQRAEEQLRQSQKMEAVGQLTGGIAHDFNNLLAAIGASLQVLQTRLDAGRTEGAVRYITLGQESVRRAAALTHRLLAFSRRQTLDPKPVDVGRLVDGMEELIRRTVGPTVVLEVVAGDALWPTRIDASQLENSLLNLCINARDAMQPAGGRLTIETTNRSLDAQAARDSAVQPGDYLSVCVTDTGCGMAPEVAARAFDPFFTTKPLGQGTGLGLSMVYGFARQSGGDLRIRTDVGTGTTLCMLLPRHAGPLEQAQGATAPPALRHGEGETVLVVEDEPTLRTLLTEMLQELGYRVLVAEDGPAGLQRLDAAGRIDLLVTDVGLPGGLNGRQVADAARIRRPDLQVLFITGYAENAAVGDGQLERGMAVITKPFDMAALTAKVRAMVER
ncbi:PAS domain-containing protein [Sphingomonas sp. NCPPB 2930]